MPDAHNVDFLRQHARLDRRVSNIETGVHPIKGDVQYENVGTDTAGGLQFDTYPQDGGWLYVRTTDPDEGTGEPDNWAIHLRDTSTYGGIYLESNHTSRFLTHDGPLELQSDLTTDILGNAILIKAYAGRISITGKFVELQSSSGPGSVTVFDDGSVEINGTPVRINGTVF